jgi:NitT/TauT family transport system substrate-binding protein
MVAQALRKGVPAEWENEAAGQLFLDMSVGMNLSVTERLGDVQPAVWTAIQPRFVSSGAVAQEVDVTTFLNDTYIAAANDFDRAEVEADAAAWLAANK